MKILITGSSGYVGYVLSNFFSEKGVSVVGVDINVNNSWLGGKNFKFYNGNVTDKDSLLEIFQSERPTHVIHLAYLMNPLHDVRKEHEIDVVGSENVISVANSVDSVKQIILFSSASAYGAWKGNKLWLSEEDELRPRDYRYAINKKKVEGYYNSYSKRVDMKLVVLRMCTAIGPLYHKKGGVVSLLVKSPIFVKFNNRYCELQFIHEEDLTALLGLIVNDASVSGTFNLAPDSYSVTRELVPKKPFISLPLKLVKGIVWVLWNLRLSSVRPAAITLSTYGIIVDPKKLMSRYGYKFKFTTLEGFKDTVEQRKNLGTL